MVSRRACASSSAAARPRTTVHVTVERLLLRGKEYGVQVYMKKHAESSSTYTRKAEATNKIA